MTKEQVREELHRLGFKDDEFVLSVTNDNRASIYIKGDSSEEAYKGNTWEDAFTEFRCTTK